MCERPLDARRYASKRTGTYVQDDDIVKYLEKKFPVSSLSADHNHQKGEFMATSNINILGIIGIIGAILMIVGVFLAWAELNILGYSLGTITGWEIFSNSDISNIVQYTFVPLVALIGGILSLVLMIIPTFANTESMRKISNILGIIAIIIAIAVIVCEILFLNQSWNILGKTVTMMNYIQFGFWLTLIGAIITAIGGIMPIAKNKMLN